MVLRNNRGAVICPSDESKHNDDPGAAMQAPPALRQRRRGVIDEVVTPPPTPMHPRPHTARTAATSPRRVILTCLLVCYIGTAVVLATQRMILARQPSSTTLTNPSLPMRALAVVLLPAVFAWRVLVEAAHPVRVVSAFMAHVGSPVVTWLLRTTWRVLVWVVDLVTPAVVAVVNAVARAWELLQHVMWRISIVVVDVVQSVWASMTAAAVQVRVYENRFRDC